MRRNAGFCVRRVPVIALLVVVASSTVVGATGANVASRHRPASLSGIIESLQGVACVSITLCQAVGVDPNSGGTATLVESWDGRAWAELVKGFETSVFI